MFLSSYDPARAAAVFLFTGGSNEDDDFERYLRVTAELAQKTEGHAHPGAILIVDPDNPMPNAAWRKRIAEETADLGDGVHFAFVSPSPLARGVVTAVNWFRRPKYEIETFARFDEAVAWLVARGAAPAHVYEELHRDVRREAEERAGTKE